MSAQDRLRFLLKKRLAELRERRWREKDDDAWEEEAAIS
jgi:hypothetical protein